MPNDEARTLVTPDEVRKIADILASYSVSSTGLDVYVAQLRRLADQIERNAEVQCKYDELVDALCSKAWLPRERHESVIALAKRMRAREHRIEAK